MLIQAADYERGISEETLRKRAQLKEKMKTEIEHTTSSTSISNSNSNDNNNGSAMMTKKSMLTVNEYNDIHDSVAKNTKPHLDMNELEKIAYYFQWPRQELQEIFLDCWNQLTLIDACEIFATKVTDSVVINYHKIISNPMELAQIDYKIHTCSYESLQTFATDVALIYENCRIFNKDNKPYVWVSVIVNVKL